MTEYKFTIPGPPQGKERHRTRRNERTTAI